MSKIRELIREKFGYTKDLPSLLDMHKDVTDGKKLSPANHPLEPYRKAIKAILGVDEIDDDQKLEDAVNIEKLSQLAQRHGFAKEFIDSVSSIKDEIAKKSPDRDKIKDSWESIRKAVPYWCLGLIHNKVKDLPEDEKKSLTNLIELMNAFNAESAKNGEEKAKNTERSSRDYQAKKNLDKARKDAGIDTDSGSEKKLSKKPEEIENDHVNKKVLDQLHDETKKKDEKTLDKKDK